MPRTVLIVEDTDFCADTLEVAFLRIPDLDIRIASNGRQALALIARSQPFSAVVTDLHLPGMTGFELIEKIRALPEGNRMPIVVISGDSSQDTPERLRRLGAAYYFPKPYSPAEVRHALEEILQRD